MPAVITFISWDKVKSAGHGVRMFHPQESINGARRKREDEGEELNVKNKQKAAEMLPRCSEGHIKVERAHRLCRMNTFPKALGCCPIRRCH